MLKQMMKAALIEDFGGIDKIKIAEVEIPSPKENEIQIAVSHAGVNPVDWKICDGLLKTRMHHQFPIILGWDVSGIVKEVGKEVREFKEGDQVYAYCRKTIIHAGSFADFICVEATSAALKPTSLSFSQAAAVPLSSLTAWQSLFDTAKLQKGKTILIHGGAGGVGSFAIQFAKINGAKVFTTASKSNHDYVKKLGADGVVDYAQENLIDQLRSFAKEGFDIVLDCVGGKTLKQSYEITKEGGILVTIVGLIDNALANQKKIHAEFVFVSPNGKELEAISTLFDQKKLLAPRVEELPFDQVKMALLKSREGHAKGKLVLKILNKI